MRRRRPACKLGSCLGSSTRGSGHFVRFAVMLNQPVSLRFASHPRVGIRTVVEISRGVMLQEMAVICFV